MSLNRELYKFTFSKVLGHFNLCFVFFFLFYDYKKNSSMVSSSSRPGSVCMDCSLHSHPQHYANSRYREKQSAALIILYQSACMLLIFHARSQSSVIGVLPYRLSGEYKKKERPSAESNLAKGTLLHLYDEIHISH